MDIRPTAHADRLTVKLHYHVVDLPEMPHHKNSVTIYWNVPFLKRIKLLFNGTLQTSFQYHSVKPMRIDI